MSKVCDYAYALEKDDNPTVHWGAVVGGPDRHDGYKVLYTIKYES